MLKVLLINNNRSLLSNDLVEEIANRGSYDFILAIEPNVCSVSRAEWMADTVGNVALRRATVNRGFGLHHRAEGTLAIELDEYVIFGIYICPNVSTGEYQNRMIQLQRLIMQSSKRVIILGDLNCKTMAAGAESTNARGEAPEDFLAATGTTCLNNGTPTFRARGHESILDLVIIDWRMALNLATVSVLEEETGSDHLAVSLEVMNTLAAPNLRNPIRRLTERQVQIVVERSAQRIIEVRRLNPDILQNIIGEEISNVPGRDVKQYSVYWWNQGIADQRTVLSSLPALNKDKVAQQMTILFPRGKTERQGTVLCERGRFTQDEVTAAVNKLKNKKNPGPDGVPAAVIKGLIRIVPWEMTDVASYGLQHNTFPDCWKTARTVVLPKSAASLGTNDYRPKSLINNMGKVVERLVAIRLQE
ncbi:uncharacterized protein LOC142319987 [Lycorma delicatula]|uniref:uncharacterized protein LOC142319987 n=1 Tax=Lycorma delicatula TaxID=130591 RepID=UPI003F51A0A7